MVHNILVSHGYDSQRSHHPIPIMYTNNYYLSHVFCIRRGVGRPVIEIDICDIEFLRGLRFSWTKIASTLGISRSTLYRRLEEEGVSGDVHYTDISK